MRGPAPSAWCHAVTGERRFDVRPSRLGAWAAPLMGMAFAFAWTPCIGPILGVVLGLAAHNGTLPGGVLLLFAYSLGLAVPFVLVGSRLRPPHDGPDPGPALALGRRARGGPRPRRLRRAAPDRQRQLAVVAALEPPQRPGPQPSLQELGRGHPVPAVDAGADVIIRALPVASPAPSPVLASTGGPGSASPPWRAGSHYRAEREARWGDAEDFYFERLMPPSAFDLVLDGSRI